MPNLPGFFLRAISLGAILCLIFGGCASESVSPETSRLPQAEPAPWEGTPAFMDSPGRSDY